MDGGFIKDSKFEKGRRKMKKIYFRVFMVLIIFMLCQITAARADLGSSVKAEYSWGDKLGRGVLNMIASPVEIARMVSVTSRTESPAYGWTAGLVQGIGMGLVRFGSGAIETLTFPFEFPKENRVPLLQPEYPWQKWDASYAADAA